MTRTLAMVASVSLLASCSRHNQETGEPDTDWYRVEEGRMEVQTPDGITLVGEYYPASEPGRPAIMTIPGSYMYPPGFYARLHANDWTVLAMDLRGIGESDGTQGDSSEQIGIHDLMQIARALVAEGFPEIAVLTNTGHESVLNGFVYRASTEGDAPVPVALGYLSPGYTGANLYVSMTWLPVLPTVFAWGHTHSDADYWLNGEIQQMNPHSWEFFYYPSGGCCADMFWQDNPKLTIEEDFEGFYMDLWPD